MSGAGRARARAKPRTIQERIQELQARADAVKKKTDLKEVIAHARAQLQALSRRKK